MSDLVNRLRCDLDHEILQLEVVDKGMNTTSAVCPDCGEPLFPTTAPRAVSDLLTRPKTSWELRCEQAERERDMLRSSGRLAIDAGEKMIATLTAERDEARRLRQEEYAIATARLQQALDAATTLAHERDEWHTLADARSAEIVRVMGERDEARADAAQLRQDVEALAAADVELRRKIADLRHIANVNGDWTVKVSELVAALNTASALLVEAQAERDGALDTITTRTWERDEAVALLLDIDQWFRQDGASFPDYIQGRLDALLGGPQ